VENKFLNDAEDSKLKPATVRVVAAVSEKTEKIIDTVTYGIEDVVTLMRGLPGTNPYTTASVVKKTLESANISVSNVVQEGERKVTVVKQKILELEKEMRGLELQAAQRRGELMKVSFELEEMYSVVELLRKVQKVHQFKEQRGL